MPQIFPKTLEELRAKVKHEAQYVDIKPYSHNIITLLLGQIAKEHGQTEANKAIVDFGLDDMGWSTH